MGLLEEERPVAGRMLKMMQNDSGSAKPSRLSATVQQDDDAMVPTMRKLPKLVHVLSPSQLQKQQQPEQSETSQQNVEQEEDDDQADQEDQEDQDDDDEEGKEDEPTEGRAQLQSRDGGAAQAGSAGEAAAQLKTGRKRGQTTADKEHKRLKRLLRNRVSAQQARERKKVYLTDLEQRSKDLEQQNAELEERVSTLQRENFMLRQIVKNTALQKSQG